MIAGTLMSGPIMLWLAATLHAPSASKFADSGYGATRVVSETNLEAGER